MRVHSTLKFRWKLKPNMASKWRGQKWAHSFLLEKWFCFSNLFGWNDICYSFNRVDNGNLVRENHRLNRTKNPRHAEILSIFRYRALYSKTGQEKNNCFFPFISTWKKNQQKIFAVFWWIIVEISSIYAVSIWFRDDIEKRKNCAGIKCKMLTNELYLVGNTTQNYAQPFVRCTYDQSLGKFLIYNFINTWFHWFVHIHRSLKKKKHQWFHEKIFCCNIFDLFRQSIRIKHADTCTHARTNKRSFSCSGQRFSILAVIWLSLDHIFSFFYYAIWMKSNRFNKQTKKELRKKNNLTKLYRRQKHLITSISKE